MHVNGWAVTFGMVRRGLGPWPAQAPPCRTKCNSPPINGQCTNFVLFSVALYLLFDYKGLILLDEQEYLSQVMFVDRNTQSCRHSASCHSHRHTFVSSTATATASTCSAVTAVSSRSATAPTARLKQPKWLRDSIQFLTYRCDPVCLVFLQQVL